LISTTDDNGKDIKIYRYWLDLIPPNGYIALGSVVIDKYNQPLPDEDHLLIYLQSYEQSIWSTYSLEKVVCVKEQYIDNNAVFIEKLITFHKKKRKRKRKRKGKRKRIY